MDNHIIESLRDALKQSPDNIPLRLLLAEHLFSKNEFSQAEEEYLYILKTNNEPKAKIGLAHVFFKKESFNSCNVILEELLDEGVKTVEVYSLYAKGLLKEKNISESIEMYQNALSLDPSFYDEELDKYLRSPSIDEFSNAYIADDDTYVPRQVDTKFLEKPTINFSDVGGMEEVKKEIDLKIIKPLQHPELYKAYGKKIGGGILLYGPPGCGKTFIAKATAGQVNAKFISLSLNDVLDMWIGNSEKNLHEIFTLARQNIPCVLFIDEIDALGASRSDMKQSSGRHLINQFLQELDGINDSNEGILIIGSTNTPWNLDTAFRRPGRFDRIIFVSPPDERSREAILNLKLKDKPTDSIDLRAIAKKTDKYSGADLDAIIDIAIEQKLNESFSDGIPKPLYTKDLLKAIKKHKASTQEWFSTAKNFALFANDSGLYDDILKYLKIKK